MSVYPKLFKEIYADRRGGYGSGGGSQEDVCWPYLRLVERVLAQYQPRTVLDIGCGDGRVASSINWGFSRYIGMDCAGEPIDMHRKLHTSWPPNELIVGDALEDELPDADLVLTKEATQHMDLASIQILLNRLRKYPRVIHTSVIGGRMNGEIEPGHCRLVNLMAKPFELPGKVTDLLSYRCGEALGFIVQMWEPK